MTLENWEKVKIGTRVKFKDKLFDNTHNGYFAGIFYPTGCLEISRISHNDEFSGIKMTDYGVCSTAKIENVELYEWITIQIRRSDLVYGLYILHPLLEIVNG